MEKFSKKPEFIQSLFNQIASDYDKLNEIMSFGLQKHIKNSVLQNLNLPPNAKILDLCTGTGDIAGILSRKYPDAQITGVDFSEKMLEIAKERYPDIEFVLGDCSCLPFEGGSFDACIISFGLRNTEDLKKVVNEIHRILKPGGVFANLDLGKPNPLLQLFMRPFLYIWAQIAGLFFHGDKTPYKYLAESNDHFPSQLELVKIFESSGFFDVENRNFLLGQIASQKCKKKVEE